MIESPEAFRFISYVVSRWRLVAVSCLTAIVLATAVSLILPREYTATARILIEPPANADPRSTLAVSQIYLESLKTYEYFANSDSLFQKAASRFHLRSLAGAKPIESLKKQVGRKYDFSQIIVGNSEPMEKVFALIEKASKTNITVSITGETGSGKELVAKAIHYNSERHNLPFVAVNVAAIPKELLESELFGHEKGSFTGAVTRRIGKFEEADKGTLFLDEIGELDINLQAKLLRVLQEREITRIGANNVLPINVRIIVATHKNLLEEVKNKTFREDLYYRLIGLPIMLPPLRERGNDIAILAKNFVDAFCKENKINRKSISPEAQQKLISYPYPGNVRELKSIMELAVVMSDEENILPEHITLNSSTSINDLLNRETTLKEFESQIIQHYLDKYNKDVLLVARKLDIGKSTIYRMIQNGELKSK